MQELSGLKEKIKLAEDIEDSLSLLVETEINEDSSRQIEKELNKLEKKINQFERNNRFTGKYDKNNAILSFHSGAGGVDAQDWTSMLLKMYQLLSSRRGWQFNVLNESFGEQGGIKNAVMEVSGQNVFGILKKESGVHRLVRVSPFSAKNLRHTSFALVDIMPEIEKPEFKLDIKDLKIDTFRSSGPGGQNVNKLETAIRITHVPTGIVVAVQSERSQAQNKDKAMQLLFSKLHQELEKEHVDEVSKLKTKLATGIEWGNQIRSYVLHPYRLVKDHRTNVQVSNPDAVLNGELDEFLDVEVATSQ